MKKPALIDGTVIIANQLKTPDKNLMKAQHRKQEKKSLIKQEKENVYQ